MFVPVSLFLSDRICPRPHKRRLDLPPAIDLFTFPAISLYFHDCFLSILLSDAHADGLNKKQFLN
jgi:hypothetical protein